MRETRVSLPELALIAATRGMIGVGVGFLVGGRLSARRRARVGWGLLAIGALSTLPLAARVIGRLRKGAQDLPSEQDLEAAFEIFGEAGTDVDTVAVFLDPEGP